MNTRIWFSRLTNQQPITARLERTGKGAAVAVFVMMAGIAVAQNPTPPAPATESQVSAPAGYTIHQSVDLGGRITNLNGSGAMYDTLVNLQSGPRVSVWHLVQIAF